MTKMKLLLLLCTIAALFTGCQTKAPSIERGIRYGMSKQELIELISGADEIISADGDTLITEGTFSPTKQRTRKIFTFQNGKLAGVRYSIL